MPWIVAALAFTLGLPSLGAGYFLDDHLHVYLLEGRPLAWSGHGIWDLYRFADGGSGTRAAIDAGNLPWWTNPELSLGSSTLLARATHPLFRDPFGNVYRKDPFAAGQRFVVQGLDATILEVDARGFPLAIRFVFDEPLEAQRWVAWKGRGFVEVPVPERGGAVVVPGTAWFDALSP